MPVAVLTNADTSADIASPTFVLDYSLTYRGTIRAGISTVQVPFGVNFTTVRVPAAGRYQFVLSTNDVDACRVGIRRHRFPRIELNPTHGILLVTPSPTR